MYEYIPEIMTFKECQNILRVGKNTLIDLIHTERYRLLKWEVDGR